jgi:hypothetical protein
MLFHVPDGASGTLDRSVAARVAVGEAGADAGDDADAASFGLAAGKGEGEPLAAVPKQPAETKAMVTTRALNPHQPRLLTNLDSMAFPPEDRP